MTFATRRYGEAVVLAPRGRIDHATADAFKAELLDSLDQAASNGDRVILDLAGVDYMASVGLRVLVLGSKKVKAQGGTLVVAAMQPVVREIYQISRFDVLLPSFASVRDAVAAVAPGALAAFDAA
jgi:anti-anti-sigma factor